MVKFYLDKKGKEECEVFLDLSHRGKRLRMFTGKKINPEHWDSAKCRANFRKYKNNAVGFNQYLQEIEDQIICLKNGSRIIGKEHIRNLLDRLQGKQTITSFFGFAEDFLKTQLSKGAIKLSTFRNHEVTLNYLREHFGDLDFEGANVSFCDKFIASLKSRRLGNNTINRHLKSLKWFLRAGFDRGVHSNMNFKKRSFSIPSQESDAVYLTTAEITQLETADLNGHLRRIADAFVINCNLGLRYGDQIQIQKENLRIDGADTYLVYVQEKTGRLISVPIPGHALTLLEKYDFECPLIKNGKIMSGQKFNEYIKDACKKAGINTTVTLRSCGRTLQGPKYEFVKSHTARRSFATNLYDQGFPIRGIMAVTGHEKEQTLLLYVKSDQRTRAKSLAKFYKESSEREEAIGSESVAMERRLA